MKTKLTSPVVITLGEPGGIGPRLVLEACRDFISNGKNFFFLIADYAKIKPLAKKFNCPIKLITDINKEIKDKKVLNVYDFPFEERIEPGVINFNNSKSIIGMLNTAVDLIYKGKASALVTGPIHKQSISKGLGKKFPGHTDFLSGLSKPKSHSVMMMQANNFRVVPLTHHVPLCAVPKLITRKKIKETVRTVNTNLKNLWEIKKPVIFISGLNPHAGEDGILGSEEINTIIPAVKELNSEGIKAFGPYSADTMFRKKIRNNYHAAICMYHDQALIPIKSLFFDSTINITLGLPIIRTSPGHGTAVEMVNAKKISITSFKNSLTEAYRLAEVKSKNL